jgi:hypothetical protein
MRLSLHFVPPGTKTDELGLSFGTIGGLVLTSTICNGCGGWITTGGAKGL